MLKSLFTLLLLLCLTDLLAQKTEFKAAVYTTLFSFKGASAEAVSFINYSDQTQSGYTNNPYGSKKGLGYGLAGQLQRVLKRNFIAGLDLGYELLRSKTTIHGISGYTGTSTYPVETHGETFLNYCFINFQPFVGYRLPLDHFHLDLTGGVDIGYCLQAKEKGRATASDGTEYKTSEDRKTINSDIRPRLQVDADYKRAGVFMSYAAGLRNYKKGYVGGKSECYGRLFRLGITYLLK